MHYVIILFRVDDDKLDFWEAFKRSRLLRSYDWSTRAVRRQFLFWRESLVFQQLDQNHG